MMMDNILYNVGQQQQLQQQQQNLDKYEEQQRRIKEAFDLFETDGVVSADDLGTCIRFLNMNPTKSQIKRIQQEMGQDYVTYDKFETVLLKILITNTYGDEMMTRDDEDTILRAFEVLDPEKNGYIETDKLVALLEQYSEGFDAEEIKEFIHAAEDPESHVVRYEDFAHILARE